MGGKTRQRKYGPVLRTYQMRGCMLDGLRIWERRGLPEPQGADGWTRPAWRTPIAALWPDLVDAPDEQWREVLR